MNSKIIIITILILVKVVGVASRARAESYFSEDCSPYSTIESELKEKATSYKNYWYSNSYKYYSGSIIYRCGQTSYKNWLN
jgi:uncharacterized protein YpmB